ncbi:MAG: hypothetical protein ACYSVY_09680 [Planctomycetota bacterium]|jgi:hypothetical protein
MPLKGEARTTVRLSASQDERSLAIRLSRCDATISASINPPCSVRTFGTKTIAELASTSTTLQITPQRSAVEATLAFREDCDVSRSITIDAIGFTSRQRSTEAGETFGAQFAGSGVSGGRIHVANAMLDHELRPFEALSLGEATGTIHRIKLTSDGLGLDFSGTVSSLDVGSGAAKRSLMPTYLVYLSTRHGTALYWTATVYVSGVILTLYRFWRTE